ncbi:Protein of unknown function [Alteribacillus persepolensis]|uniref:Uncharacterized protein n=1 Tax=Alteribacillus persepolensis TaxID=568899 RepID=A0A1G8FMD9_9BACI|nr:DUF1516 family protein [Alteribacillus persepolensis]SDH83249.1 Protein of unknown function [Alteribacillus persepolensis]
MESIFYESHAGSWFFLILFFVISYLFAKQKITLMLQRLFALIMIISGAGMLVFYGFPLLYILKGVLAILLIAVMEMLVARKKRGEPQGGLWAACIVLIIVVLLLGFNVIG